ncbi:MAG: aldo/keto reductase [Bacteroidia bacterium]|nr:aldo/keto reductase [Bacteroidia bacterium]
METKDISRRSFLKGIAAVGATIATSKLLSSCTGEAKRAEGQPYDPTVEVPKDKMTYRTNPNTGDKVSILGYGCMRWPMKKNDEGVDEIDQEKVNQLVDYALEHGVNYFDTAPVYCQGRSENATGIALSRHPRESYYIATKMSNFAPEQQTYEASVKIFENSLKYLRTDYIDYLLLHSVGGGGIANFNKRFIDNGILDYLFEQKKRGVIRNLGFSFHGDVEVFDYLLSKHDEWHWDFVQIQLNYLDWKHAKEQNKRNVDAEYLYGELEKRGIPAIIMEPLLGGRLSKVHDHIAETFMERAPGRSIASWAFRFAGHYDGVLTVLSGMTYMEHLQDNIRTYSPLEKLTEEELAFLEKVAQMLISYKTIPCNDCKYCMPCPYGIDIPTILLHYNKAINEGFIPGDREDTEYRALRRKYLISYMRGLEPERRADHCVGCGICVPHCPQGIRIPNELTKINRLVDSLLDD